MCSIIYFNNTWQQNAGDEHVAGGDNEIGEQVVAGECVLLFVTCVCVWMCLSMYTCTRAFVCGYALLLPLLLSDWSQLMCDMWHWLMCNDVLRDWVMHGIISVLLIDSLRDESSDWLIGALIDYAKCLFIAQMFL
jgi:hypothetical protein